MSTQNLPGGGYKPTRITPNLEEEDIPLRPVSTSPPPAALRCRRNGLSNISQCSTVKSFYLRNIYNLEINVLCESRRLHSADYESDLMRTKELFERIQLCNMDMCVNPYTVVAKGL
jgi:hypothetical protein